MSVGPENRQATPRHPFAAALEARDHAALVDTLAPDVVLHPPVALTTFDGREVVGELYASELESFEEIEVVDEFSGGDTHVLFWRGRMEGASSRARTGCVWTVRAGCVRSRAWGRPLSGLVTFLTGIDRGSRAVGGAGPPH